MVVAEQPFRLSMLVDALGARKGVEDYSSSRISSPALIEDVCEPLIVFERTSSGNTNDPFVKLAHKSVQDFLLQDPKSFDTGVELHKYFIDMEAAHLEVGEICLTYLKYARYNTAVDVPSLLVDDSRTEHAFLSYAAACWFKHLMYLQKPADHVVPDIEHLLKTQAFWTCLAMQSKVASHLLGYKTKVTMDGEQKIEELHFGVPLPFWLEKTGDSGARMAKEFTALVKQWHLVFFSFPTAVDYCTPNIAGSMQILVASLASGRTPEVLDLCPLKDSNKSWKIVPHSTQLLEEEGMVQVDFYLIMTDGIQHTISLQRIHRSLKGSGHLEDTKAKTTTSYAFSSEEYTCVDPLTAVHFSIDPYSAEPTLWCLELENLNIMRCASNQNFAFESRRARSKPDQEEAKSSWTVQKVSSDSSSAHAVAYHCSNSILVSGVHDRDDASSEDPDSSSDSGSSSQDEFTEDDTAHTSHCLCIASQYGSPIWFDWQAQSTFKSPVFCAFHPIERLAIWSHAAHELCIANLYSGKLSTRVLPEPVEVSFHSATTVHKGTNYWHISADKKLLR